MTTMINRITMQGFKSFNRRISIPFLKGFNVICGPNGSGKSNVVDGICFVLGRTSAKSLRADRLHELIFHGGDGKKPAPIASVSLFLDNTNKVFPFEEPEISVTRKVNRKGVSIYKLNGKTVTREKILEALSGARIKSDGHNIILQGDVTQIIEMNPIERRYIIDEISGIAEYNDKKNRASRDLEAVDLKLKEAEIIITERYDIYKRLEDERNAALKYQQLQKDLLILKASIAHKKFEKFEFSSNEIDMQMDNLKNQGEGIDKKVLEIETELEQQDKILRGMADNLMKASKMVRIEKEVSGIRTEILIARDKINSNQREIERLDSLIEKLESIESHKAEASGAIPRAVKTILGLKIKGVEGIVADLIRTPERYQIAIEVAAGNHMQDLVVEDDNVAKYCIDYLKREKIGRATFLPLNKIKERDVDRKVLGSQGVIGLASELISFDHKFDPAIQFVLGGTVVIQDLNVAQMIGIGKARMVTLTGDLIEKSGAMIGGYYIRRHPQMIESSAKDEVEAYRKAKHDLEAEIMKFSEDVTRLEHELSKYSKSDDAKEMIDFEKIKVDSQRKLEDLRDQRRRLYDRKLKTQSELNGLAIQRAKMEGEFENIKIELEEYGKIKYLEQDLAAMEKQLKDVAAELQKIGAVNFKSIEQYDKFKGEFDEYKKKYEKILEEKKAVLDMIGKIEEKRKEVFYKCLNELSVNFKEVFNRMVKGTASLELEDPNDLESGLKVMVVPEGKLLMNIDSLSGGEKTLTALAFLFAIQQCKPAPFYILDEVDAALDKANSQKVALLIKALSEKEQFIMITHNDQTIKYADRVYGVTMEQGESRILGLEMPA